MLLVLCTKPELNRIYEIREAAPDDNKADRRITSGCLLWEWVRDRSPDFVFDRAIVFETAETGYLQWTPVTEEQAMAITGLQHPMAALDKLRDLVHES